MTRNQFFTWLKKASLAILFFFGRFLRDIGKEWWKPIRRRMVKWSYVWIPLLIMVALSYTDRALFEQLMMKAVTAGIIIIGFKTIFLGHGVPFKKKKKKKR